MTSSTSSSWRETTMLSTPLPAFLALRARIMSTTGRPSITGSMTMVKLAEATAPAGRDPSTFGESTISIWWHGALFSRSGSEHCVLPG